MIGVINYGCGNLGSIINMCRHIGIEASIVNSVKDLKNCERFILPGVGHFDFGMSELNKSGLLSALEFEVFSLKKPILGICLGAQMLTSGSEEGVEEGLGWIDATTVKFDLQRRKVPHMGWNNVNISCEHPLFKGLEAGNRFYFVHKYFMNTRSEELSLGKTSYEIIFDSIIGKENIVGVQFHPEKSHAFGMKLLQNFELWRPF